MKIIGHVFQVKAASYERLIDSLKDGGFVVEQPDVMDDWKYEIFDRKGIEGEQIGMIEGKEVTSTNAGLTRFLREYRER